MQSGHIRIEVRSGGGFTGIDQHGFLDTDELAPEEARRVRELVDRIDLEALARPSEPEEPPRPDHLQYEVILTEGDRTRQVSFGQRGATPEALELISLVLRRARPD